MLVVLAATDTQIVAVFFLCFVCLPTMFIANIWMAITVMRRKSHLAFACILVPILNPVIAKIFWPHTKAAICLRMLGFVATVVSGLVVISE